MWTPPKITPRPVSRAAYGFDAQGQLVADVSGQALRAVQTSMLAALRGQLQAQQAASETITQAVKDATQIWLDALNLSLSDSPPLTDAWIKGTMYSYSTEFFFLADAYARQICGNPQVYVRNLVEEMLPASLKQIGEALTLSQIYSTHTSLFQHAPPLDLRSSKKTRDTMIVDWHCTPLMTRVAPVYRDELVDHMSEFIQMMLVRVPELVKNQPAAQVEVTSSGEDVIRWRVHWLQKPLIPRSYAAGAAVLLVVAVVGGILIGNSVVSTLVAAGGGVGATALAAWMTFRSQRQRINDQKKALLDHIEYTQLQSLELNTVYASLRGANADHEKQVRGLTAVRDAVLAISGSFDQARVLNDLLQVMTKVLGFDRAMVLLRDRETDTLRFGAASHPPGDSRDQMRLQHMQIEIGHKKQDDPLLKSWTEGQSIVISDPTAYLRSSLNWLLAMLEFNNFYSVPLMLGTELLGVVLVDNHFSRRSITLQERSLVDALTTNIAITMENARLYNLQDSQLQKNLFELQILEQIDRELTKNLRLNYVMEMLIDWAMRFTNAHFGAILMVDEKLETGRYAVYYGCEESHLIGGKAQVPVPLADLGIAGRAALGGKNEFVQQVSSDPDHRAIIPETQSHISVLISRRNRIIGIMTIETSNPDGFETEHWRFMQRLAARAGVAIDNARLYAESQQERDKLGAILNNTADAVVVVNEDNHISLLNKAARLVFRFSQPPEEFIGHPFHEIFLDSPLGQFFNQMLQDKNNSYSAELTIGKSIYQASATQVEGVGYAILLHDITLFKEIDKLKDELVSTVSHDLKNPLSVLNAYVEMIDMTQTLNDAGQRYVDRIRHSVKNMHHLIDALLDLAKIDAGFQLKCAPVSVAELVRHTFEEQGITAQKKNITLTTVVSPELPWVFAEDWRIQQVLNNFVNNGIKYTPNGGSVEITALQEGDFVRIEVKDTGYGIPADQLNKVWERFERIRDERTKHISGTGLGLTIAKTVVEAHGGQVGVTSTEGVGSTFWFTVPVYTEDMDA
ncbi:MAG: GAF domain-containing protein [Anaerolineae bacterium]|nr:GAF domain-containing protein [Anaerolineae bacterium]